MSDGTHHPSICAGDIQQVFSVEADLHIVVGPLISRSSVALPASGEFADRVMVLPFRAIFTARDFPSEIVETRSMALLNIFETHFHDFVIPLVGITCS
jgi:hypothetical protein